MFGQELWLRRGMKSATRPPKVCLGLGQLRPPVLELSGLDTMRP